jgi:hypothetical protein
MLHCAQLTSLGGVSGWMHSIRSYSFHGVCHGVFRAFQIYYFLTTLEDEVGCVLSKTSIHLNGEILLLCSPDFGDLAPEKTFGLGAFSHRSILDPTSKRDQTIR